MTRADAPRGASLAALTERLPRTTLIVGKGGVGKTTCATRIARAFAERGERTLLMSTDPAAALVDVLGSPVAKIASPVDGVQNLDARQLDAAALRAGFLGRWREVIAAIVDRGTYLDRSDVDGLVDAALPGADEIFALLALADTLADSASPYARIVVDTAPTGHTLRLLALPDTFRALVAMLDAMQEKHRFMVRALTRRYRRDAADAFLEEMRTRIDGLRRALTDGRSLAALLVMRAEPVVELESRRYLAQLRQLQVRVAAVVVNALPPGTTSRPLDRDIEHVVVPLESRLSRTSTHGKSKVSRRTSTGREAVAAESLVRTLTIVGGKGGVGKTTVSCGLALAASDALDGRTLLVSTDPAPSLADALGEPDAPWARADIEHELSPMVTVRQMDASAAFTRVRDAYQSRIDALFDTLVGRGLDVQHDRDVLRDLLALAPPGVDELFALSLLGDALAEQRFARIIVDPAPTGHLLRLLDMPSIALDWTHRLMRLMLKYKDVVGLGDTAEELLAFAKRTRALDALLRNGRDAGLALVGMNEPVVRSETARVADAVRERGVDLVAIIWNRAGEAVPPLPSAGGLRQFCADEVSPPPVGAAAIRAWMRSWHSLASTS